MTQLKTALQELRGFLPGFTLAAALVLVPLAAGLAERS